MRLERELVCCLEAVGPAPPRSAPPEDEVLRRVGALNEGLPGCLQGARLDEQGGIKGALGLMEAGEMLSGLSGLSGVSLFAFYCDFFSLSVLFSLAGLLQLLDPSLDPSAACEPCYRPRAPIK